MSRFTLDGCTALITGASAGIGAEFARQLATRAGGLVLVARREERLNELRDELTKRDPNLNVIVRATDLSDSHDVFALLEWLHHERIAIDLLINNAGVGDYGPFATSDAERVREIVAVNISALTQLTRELLPPMIERRRGGILNVSSSAGLLPIPGMALYAATKSYVTSLSEALRLELRDSGVHVTALCPGPVYSEFNTVARRAGTEGRSAPAFTHVGVSTVVRAALRGIERNQPLVIPGLLMKLGMALVRATPMPILRAFANLNERA
jgi:short-subunit dehydrogenase